MNYVRRFCFYTALVVLSGLSIQNKAIAIGGQAGGISDGGGYAFDQAHELLDNAVAEILAESNSWKDDELNPDRLKLIKTVVARIRREPNKTEFRNEKELRYNYTRGDKKLGTVDEIIALRPFFTSYAGVTPEQYPVVILQIKRDIIHEISHLWGLGVDDNNKSKEFALRIYPVKSKVKNIIVRNGYYLVNPYVAKTYGSVKVIHDMETSDSRTIDLEVSASGPFPAQDTFKPNPNSYYYNSGWTLEFQLLEKDVDLYEGTIKYKVSYANSSGKEIFCMVPLKASMRVLEPRNFELTIDYVDFNNLPASLDSKVDVCRLVKTKFRKDQKATFKFQK